MWVQNLHNKIKNRRIIWTEECAILFDLLSVQINTCCWKNLAPCCPNTSHPYSLLGGSGAVVNSLDICPASLKSLASVYFLHNGRWWQWICKFYTANFKGIFGGLYSECVWQQAITCCSCYRMPQNAFFPQNRNLLASPKYDVETLFFQHPSPFPRNVCNCNSGGICTASQF